MAKFNLIPVEHDPWADLPKGPTELKQGPMSWTDYLPFVKEAFKIYGKEKLGELLGAVTAPGDALSGRLDPGTPEGLRRVQALAGLAMGGPAKPSGAVGAGWQFPHDLALAYWKDSPHHQEARALVAYMKEFGKTLPQAAKDLGASEKAVGTVQNIYMPNPAHYSHQSNEPLTSHPATYGMTEQEVRAAAELLDAMKQFPEEYPKVANALEGLGSYVEPHELGHFESAAKKLEDWAGPHGFKFQEVDLIAKENEDALKKALADFDSAVGTPFKETYTPPKTVSIEEALYPINWSDLHSTVRRPGQEASGAYADTLRRAEALGFNTNFPLYHGAFETKVKYPEDPSKGIWGEGAKTYHAFGDPREMKGFERGIFTADTPEIAGHYSGGSDADIGRGQTFPLFANPKKTLAVDWPAVSGNPSYSSNIMNRLIEAAHKQQADALVVQGMQDIGGAQNQYVFLRPNVLRSQFAMFDPKKVDSPNLLHAGGLGSWPMLVPVDHDPFAEPNL